MQIHNKAFSETTRNISKKKFTSTIRPLGKPPPRAKSSVRQPLGKVSLPQEMTEDYIYICYKNLSGKKKINEDNTKQTWILSMKQIVLTQKLHQHCQVLLHCLYQMSCLCQQLQHLIFFAEMEFKVSVVLNMNIHCQFIMM